MMNSDEFPASCGVAIPFDDIAVDEFEPDERLVDIDDLLEQDLLMLSPWSMCFKGDSKINAEDFAEMFGQFWLLRGDVMFMEKPFLEVCGVVRGHPDFPEGIRLTELKVARLTRAIRQTVPVDSSENELIAHDLLIITTEEGVNFGIFSDNASRIGQAADL